MHEVMMLKEKKIKLSYNYMYTIHPDKRTFFFIFFIIFLFFEIKKDKIHCHK